MNSLIIAAGAGGLFFLGYRFYGRVIERLYGADPSRNTPATEKYDGVDYVPAKHWTVLFGHHFSSIAGAAPVVGPILALAYWGWLPALLWIVLGTMFIGGVHDFGSLMASVRHGGSSIAHVAERLVSKRARILFSAFTWLALVLIIAVFTEFCARTLVVENKIVIPTFGLIPVAVFTGYLLYRRKAKQVPTTVFGLGLLAGMIVLGAYVPVNLGGRGLEIWMVVLFLYCIVASVTPVQLLLQPRDYLSAFLLFVGIGIGYLGLVVSHPVVRLPAFTGWKAGVGPLWPMLFVTVACGAISGFHSLISSGTTSKQIATEKHARRIGYGAMVAEGLVATLALLAVASGFTGLSSLTKMVKAGQTIPAFGQGFSFVTRPILGEFGGLMAITILNAFILTTLDTATRIARYITEELLGIGNRIVATVVPVVLAGGLVWGGKAARIWTIFGAANQLVAALALIVVTMWLLSQRKLIRYTLYPAIFMLVTTIGSLIYGLAKYCRGKEVLLAIISAVLIGLSLLLLAETVAAVLRGRRGTQSVQVPSPSPAVAPSDSPERQQNR